MATQSSGRVAECGVCERYYVYVQSVAVAEVCVCRGCVDCFRSDIMTISCLISQSNFACAASQRSPESLGCALLRRVKPIFTAKRCSS